MRLKRSFSLTLIIACLIFSSSVEMLCQSQQGELLVNKNLKLSLELLSPLSTATNQKGDKFNCKVLSPVEYAGAIVEGHVRKSKRSGKEKGKSEMDLAFETITLMDGRLGNFNAQVVEVFDVVDIGDQGRADNEGAVRAKSTVKRDALKIGAGAAIGALIGGMIGGGQGAAIGALIGAGIATSTTLATRGPDLEFKQGTQFTVVTNSPARQTGIAKVPGSDEKAGPAAASVETPGKPVLKRQDPVAVVTNPGAVPAMAQPLPAAQPTRLAKPNAPSERFKVYSTNKSFRLGIPLNWRESSSKDPVTFAPDRGNIFHKGKLNLTHGIMVGTLASQSKELRGASEQFVGALLKASSYLSQRGDYRSEIIAGRAAQAVTLSGITEVTGSEEIVTIYTTMLRDGEIFYLITVTPQEDLHIYQPAFQNILRSVQINE